MRIASKSLMSIKWCSPLSSYVVRWSSGYSFFDVDVAVFQGSDRRVLLVDGASELDTLEVVEHLVGGKRQLTVLVDTVLALLELLRRGLARGGAQRAGREVDAELL